ncbi:hypothetical protein [Natrarchaeobaculum aegyptiacum]|uniref:Uncharacterized protein n=1 Tax=Natrarchaeobaculum aegyptiacum TaxID=745377 RepID=A0A2Z2I2K2_9EURY|nr:hypothetical protein [Natrarchaeobaculum aegyptiacum]ARS91138.1 hypothetical protein B1756_16330 [Natrarchaeobaculum aegyptiacum]
MATYNDLGLPFDTDLEEDSFLEEFLDSNPNAPVHAFIGLFYVFVFGYFVFIVYGFLFGVPLLTAPF